MKKIITITFACLLVAGCSRFRHAEIPDNAFAKIAENDTVAIIQDSSLRRGNAATDGVYNETGNSLNPLAAFQAGQANAAQGGYADAVNKFAAKDTHVGGVNIVFAGQGAHEAAAKAYIEGNKFGTKSTHSVNRTSEISIENEVEALKAQLEFEKNLSKLRDQFRSIEDSISKVTSNKTVQDLIESEVAKKEEKEESGVNTESSGGIPGGNPFGTNVSDEQDADGPTSNVFLWKPQREGNSKEAAILLPFPIRAAEVTANGKNFRRNSLSNGWRSTWYGPKQSGSFKVQALDDKGNVYEWSVPNGGKRKEYRGVPKPVADVDNGPSNSDGLVAVKEVGKHDLFFNGEGQIIVSKYLADLERKSNNWLAGKEANKNQGPVSNILIENAGSKRHVFIRTANPRVYLVPSSVKAGHVGDLKIRYSPTKIHSYLRAFKVPETGTINIKGSVWLDDFSPWGRKPAPPGWS